MVFKIDPELHAPHFHLTFPFMVQDGLVRLAMLGSVIVCSSATKIVGIGRRGGSLGVGVVAYAEVGSVLGDVARGAGPTGCEESDAVVHCSLALGAGKVKIDGVRGNRMAMVG